HSSRIAAANPQDYEARSNIMWTATWALNTLIAKGKTTDWMVHMMGHSVSSYTDATHGMTLAAVTLPYFRYILPWGLPKFVRFARVVWGIDPAGKSDEEVALAGLDAMKAWMQEIGLVLSLRELGVTPDMLDGIAEGTFLLRGGYKPDLTTAEIRKILEQAL
ncbi:MAG: iron-containing alcohol dehydrogenase, partial [Akkermansia sp.]|nr:iron-containing alcohol dehydrogenase [Akkermansia sp.]